jgi:hypothetical protein
MGNHIMKEESDSKRGANSLIIQIAPVNWIATGPVPIKIWHMPAWIIPFNLPYVPRAPWRDVWQTDEFVYAYEELQTLKGHLC